MKRRIPMLLFVVATTVLSLGRPAAAAPSIAEAIGPDVYVVRDETGAWGGTGAGMTHQRGPDYWAKKVLDLSGVPEDFWKAASRVRLSVFFAVRDYSWHDLAQPNGLDEAFEILVNSKVHRVATNSGVPVYGERQSAEKSFRWHDFELPKEELVRGPNEFVFRLVTPEGKKPDDYLYLGIDNSVPGGNSWVRLGPKQPWRQDRITAVDGGSGEYMVRLYLLRGTGKLEATWRPGAQNDDPAGVFLYAGTHKGTTRVEWDSRRVDLLSPLTIAVETGQAKPFDLFWLDAEGKRILPALKARGPRYQATLPPPLKVPGGLEMAETVGAKAVQLSAIKNYHPLRKAVDMAPHIAPPKGKPADRPSSCQIEGDAIRMANATLRCEFSRAGGKLCLVSLHNEIASSAMVRRADDCSLFLVEVAGKRYAGSRDFVCRSVTASTQRSGFRAILSCEPIGLEAALDAWIDGDLHMGLSVTNRSAKPVDFKLAFPHLSGLAIADSPAEDYYFFPWGGGIISDAPAVIRRGYGDHEALYQVMDLFSPARGAGLAIWCTDDDGRHKVLALRKHVPGQAETSGDLARTPTDDEFKWTNSLPPVPGVGVAYEYLRRTREPGQSFAAKDVLLRAHAGDWHAAMRDYAVWCHQAWKFRPYPSRLTPLTSMIARGWGQDVLFRDGKYLDDLVKPRTDCVELMSWWEWSPLGPWGTPIDEVAQKLGEAKAKSWKSYFAKDPVTGKLMFNNNPGDYDGYNARWGGLPPLREAIKSYQKAGALVTLYTDPMRCDGNSRCGQKWGKLWGVVKPHGKHRDDYDAWRMCLDVAEYRQWTAQAMRRVLQETGADGIRLDEHGHCGSACFSKVHQHTFAEWGNTEWQRATAESTRLVREAMDQVSPKSVLTTEHPGYDFLMPFMDGCITYDLTVQATPLRPLECNTQRFYFPECKALELVHRPGVDVHHHKRLWNAVGSFGALYPARMYQLLQDNDDAFASRDCEPLVPTLAKFVYANRFAAGEKTLYTLFNAAGHTFTGDVLKLKLQPGEHLFDLLECREAETSPASDGSGTVVRVFLARDESTCLARLPARLTVKRSGDVLGVTADQIKDGQQIRVCDLEGQTLTALPAAGSVRLDLAKLDAKTKPAACVKLMDGPRLIDVVSLPAKAK